jgi:transcription factor MAFF/G/K
MHLFHKIFLKGFKIFNIEKMSSTNNENNISDEALLNLSVKDLNKLLKSLSNDDRNKLKKRRRILKNRGYAANCRTKRMSQKEILQMKKEKLNEDVRRMEHKNEMLKLKLGSIKERFAYLQTYAKILESKKEAMSST